MYPGYRRVVVEAAITVDTNEFMCASEGLLIINLSEAILFSAELSSTTTASALRISLLMVRIEL